MNIKSRTAARLASALLFLCAGAFGQTNGLIDAAKLYETDVWDFHGKKLGDIKQVLVEPTTGRARFAVIQVDKAWDLNDPEIAVPWGALKITRKGGNETVGGKVEPKFEFALDATKDKLAGAPRYKVGDADRLFTRDGGGPIYEYWAILWTEEAPRPANKP